MSNYHIVQQPIIRFNKIEHGYVPNTLSIKDNVLRFKSYTTEKNLNIFADLIQQIIKNVSIQLEDTLIINYYINNFKYNINQDDALTIIEYIIDLDAK